MDARAVIGGAVTAVVVLLAAAPAWAGGPLPPPRPRASVTGTVFDDANDDGLLSPGEDAMAGVVVAWNSSIFTTTDVDGVFRFDVDAGEAIVWARTPQGFVPGPVWRAIRADGTDPPIELGLARARTPASGTFVVAADTHLGRTTEAEVHEALAQAASGLVTPEFLTVVGDLADAGAEVEMEAFVRATRALGLPIVPVPGNHDWEDGGPNYRRLFGPPMYSFDAAGAHVVVLNFNDPIAAQLQMVELDLARVEADRTVVVLTHAPPSRELGEALADRGVDLLFSGHWHANRIVEHGTLLELNTETAAMGGLDYTPAGYRVVTLGDDGLRVTHHVVVDTEVLELASPRPGSCVAPGPVELLASAELGAGTRDVRIELDGQTLALAPRGGWLHGADVVLTKGVHRFVLEATGGRGRSLRREGTICAADGLVVPAPALPWAQHQAGPRHHGATEVTIAPPLRQAWARPLGGHARGGSPVVSDGRVIVPVLDLADGTRGGVIALDAITGRTLWEHRTGASVHGTPAIEGELVVVASQDGLVRALDVTTGAERWRVDLGAAMGHPIPPAPEPQPLALDDTWLYASPTIAEGRVLVGVARRMVSLELATGALRWSADPAPTLAGRGPFAAVAASRQLALGVFGRGLDGLIAFDPGSGVVRWTLGPPLSTSMQPSPVLDDDVAYVCTVQTHVCAVDLVTGLPRWSIKLHDSGVLVDWGFALFATPALAGGRLVIGDARGRLHALDAATGAIAWQVEATGPANVKPLPYETRGEGWLASPIITGDVVWAAGMDGTLIAVELISGALRGRQDLGAPALSGLAASGNTIYVATWDGAIRALVVDPGAEPGRARACGIAPGARRGGIVLVVLLALPLLRRRRAGASARAGASGTPRTRSARAPRARPSRAPRT